MEEIKKTVEIIPLGAELDETITFQMELLPEWLQLASNEHAESYGTPPELWATAFLSGIAAAAGKKIKLISGNYRNYPQLWVMVVGTSGSGKSEAFKVAFRRLNEVDAQKYAQYQMQLQEWEQNEKQGNKPRWEQLCINDSTPEALFSVLKHSHNGLTLYRDELSGWFGDIGRYAKSGEIGHYLSIFDNSNFSINRKQENPQLITEPLLNIFGTIQPSVLGDVLTKNNAEGSGFAQRFLFLYPDFPARKYQSTTVQPTTYKTYEGIIDSIVNIDGEAEVALSDDASKQYEAFFNEMEKERCKGDEFWAAVYAKAQIQVLRLALTIAIARSAEINLGCEVGGNDMQCAIMMQRYFLQSLEKFKSERGEPKKGKSDLVKEIFSINPNAVQTEVASVLNTTKQYVNRIVRGMCYSVTVLPTANALPQTESAVLTVTHRKAGNDNQENDVLPQYLDKANTVNDLREVTSNTVTHSKTDSDILNELPF